MRILFTIPCWNLEKTVNHGIASLSAVLRRAGHITVLKYIDSFDFSRIYDDIKFFEPDIIAVYTTTNQWRIIIKLIPWLKKHFKAAVIAGGPHITFSPESLSEIPLIDGACRGEGELALEDFARKLERSESTKTVSNFLFMENSKVIENEVGPLINNLDALPMPDYSIFSKEIFLNYPSLSLSRGCPFDCSYCCNEFLRELYKGKGAFIRFKSVDRAIAEIEMTVGMFNPVILNFDDDSFTKSRKWLEEFCAEYSKKIKLPFRCNTRPECLDEQTANMLKKTGCELISIGIESGNEDLRQKALNRNMSNEKILSAFRLCRKYGIKTSSFNMVGLPGETPELFQETIDINLQASPDLVQLTIFYPYPGTKLGKLCAQKGYLTAQDCPGYFRKGIIETPEFSNSRIIKEYRRFYWEVFKNRSLLKAVYLYTLKVYLEEYPFFWNMTKTLKRTLKKFLKI